MRFVNLMIGVMALVAGGLAVGGVVFFGRFAFESGVIAATVLAPAAFLVLFCFSLTRSSVWRINLVATCVVGVVILYGVELAIELGVVGPRPGAAGPASEDADRRTKAEIVADLRNAGRDAHLAVYPNALLENRGAGVTASTIEIAGRELLPLGGISRTTNVHCNETGRYPLFEFDEHGFHNPRGIWPLGRADIVAVGDSHTFGACVDTDKNFMALIRERHPRTLNLGMPANGPLLMLASLREYVPALEPKIVLWFFTEENDLANDLPLERRVPLLLEYLEPGFSQRLLQRQPEIDRRLRAWLAERASRKVSFVVVPDRQSRWGGVGLRDLALLRGLRDALNIVIGPGRDTVSLFKEILRAARDQVDSAGGKLVFVYLPSRRRFANLASTFVHDLTHERVLIVVGKELGIPVVDLTPVFAARDEPSSLFYFHMTEEGNARVAGEVLRAIEGLGIKPRLAPSRLAN